MFKKLSRKRVLIPIVSVLILLAALFPGACEDGGTPGSYLPVVITPDLQAPTGRTATYNIAASDATALEIAQADYICNGTDDDVEINNAIAALAGGGGILPGGVVNLSHGTFVIESTISLNLSNLTFRGSGAGTIIKAGTTLAGHAIQTSSAKNHIIIEYLSIDGDELDNNQCGVALNGSCTDITVSNLHIYDCNNTYSLGVVAESCSDFLITNNYIEDCYKSINATGSSCHNGRVVFNHCTGSLGTSIEIDDGCYDVACSYNVVEAGADFVEHGAAISCHNHNTGTDGPTNISLVGNIVICTAGAWQIYGIRVVDYGGIGDPPKNITFSMNSVTSNSTSYHCILVSGGQDITVTANCTEGGNRGIAIYSGAGTGKWIEVSSNTVSNADYCGIEFDGVTYSSANGNIITDDAGVTNIGILEDNSSNYNIFTNNTISGVLTSAVSFSGENTNVSGNNGYIAPGEIRTVSKAITAGAQNTVTSIQNPEAQDCVILEAFVSVTAAATATNPTYDMGTDDDGSGAPSDGNNLFDAIPDTVGYYRSTNGAGSGTQTEPVVWNAAGGASDYVNFIIVDAAGADTAGTFDIQYMGLG